MIIHLISRSDAFRRHVVDAVGLDHNVHPVSAVSRNLFSQKKKPTLFLLHASSIGNNLIRLIEQIRDQDERMPIAVAADHPELAEMLSLTRFHVGAYFNSYMSGVHYQQMLRLLESGQTWYAPDLLARALELAGRTATQGLTTDEISRLTAREKDVTRAVARGLSNKQIASALNITERTVKTHLTHIFEKLDIKDRTTLAIRLNATLDSSQQKATN